MFGGMYAGDDEAEYLQLRLSERVWLLSMRDDVLMLS